MSGSEKRRSSPITLVVVSLAVNGKLQSYLAASYREVEEATRLRVEPQALNGSNTVLPLVDLDGQHRLLLTAT